VTVDRLLVGRRVGCDPVDAGACETALDELAVGGIEHARA
jgi:hypothetical protein